jgi:GTP-binding protein Era
VLGIHTTPTAQAVFVDTPGLHRPTTSLGSFMVREARTALAEADVVVWVVDAGRDPDPEDARTARRLRGAGRPVLLVMNRSDLLRPDEVLSRSDSYRRLHPDAQWLLTIATERHNLEELSRLIEAALPLSPPLFPADQLTDQSERQFAAELVREAALKYLQQEVPHGVEVVIEDWQLRDNGVLAVAAKIIVERSSHKAIAIGDRGAMVKQIGTTARRELERWLDRRVFLELFVTVREGWRHRAADVRRMGYR